MDIDRSTSSNFNTGPDGTCLERNPLQCSYLHERCGMVDRSCTVRYAHGCTLRNWFAGTGDALFRAQNSSQHRGPDALSCCYSRAYLDPQNKRRLVVDDAKICFQSTRNAIEVKHLNPAGRDPVWRGQQPHSLAPLACAKKGVAALASRSTCCAPRRIAACRPPTGTGATSSTPSCAWH
jgi:hypothetical protein